MNVQSTSLLSRFVGGLFSGGAAATQISEPPVATPASDAPQVVGQGGENETLVHIAGIPHLFVDEGTHVVEFMPAFESSLKAFERFGTKMLPELIPHWEFAREHRGDVKCAVLHAIRNAQGKLPKTLSGANAEQDAEKAEELTSAVAPVDEVPQTAVGTSERRERASRTASFNVGSARERWRGKVTGWGEEEFPRREVRKGQKPTYRSFALRLQFKNGAEKVLQGEGLKDAIRAAGCKIGQTVSVQRLGKEKVPAFNDDDTPMMRNGVRVEWDRWVWKITC